MIENINNITVNFGCEACRYLAVDIDARGGGPQGTRGQEDMEMF